MVRLLYPSLQEPVLTQAQTPEVVTESRWHQPWSEPVRRIVATCLVVAAASTFVTSPIVPTDAPSWFKPLSEPIVKQLKLPVCCQPDFQPFVDIVPISFSGFGIFFETGWNGPTFIQTILYPSLPGYSESQVFSTIAPVSSWASQWETYQTTLGLLAANQQATGL